MLSNNRKEILTYTTTWTNLKVMLSAESQERNIAFFSGIRPSLQGILETTDAISRDGKRVSGSWSDTLRNWIEKDHKRTFWSTEIILSLDYGGKYKLLKTHWDAHRIGVYDCVQFMLQESWFLKYCVHNLKISFLTPRLLHNSLHWNYSSECHNYSLQEAEALLKFSLILTSSVKRLSCFPAYWNSSWTSLSLNLSPLLLFRYLETIKWVAVRRFIKN